MNKDRKVRTNVKRTLQISVFLSAFFVIMGFIFRSLLLPQADKFFMTGILVILFSPVMRVIMLVYGYLKAGEYKFSLVSLIVLLFLSIAFAL